MIKNTAYSMRTAALPKLNDPVLFNDTTHTMFMTIAKRVPFIRRDFAQ
jgi:hypothetical protein